MRTGRLSCSTRSLEIMKATNPSRLVATTSEIPDCTIGTYQSSRPTDGCIMRSVTSSHGQLGDTPDVFVNGAALFLRNPVADPMGAVAAVTCRADDAIRERYGRAPHELLD
jgi:hypothetical protein